jgi:hypothetical protein
MLVPAWSHIIPRQVLGFLPLGAKLQATVASEASEASINWNPWHRGRSGRANPCLLQDMDRSARATRVILIITIKYDVINNNNNKT